MSGVGLTIGVDVGGTKVAAGVVDGDGRILTRHRKPTPSTSPADIADTIAGLVHQLRRDHEVTAVGVGAAGFVDAQRSHVIFAPNLAWRDEPLRDELERRMRLPVVIENDANTVAWAEHRFGAGEGASDVVALTLGTGIGGGLVFGGRLYRGSFGFGAEMGHLRMVPDGRLCGCGKRGCWEQYASGQALVREARARAAEERGAASLLLSLGDGTPEGIQGRHVTAAARRGDPVAVAAYEALAHWLGLGLADLATVLDPAVFVIGGGVSDADDLLLEPARKAFLQALPVAEHRPAAELRKARLGSHAGLVGAADLARS